MAFQHAGADVMRGYQRAVADASLAFVLSNCMDLHGKLTSRQCDSLGCLAISGHLTPSSSRSFLLGPMTTYTHSIR